MPIAICYALKSDFEKAELLYQKYLVTNPNSIRGIRGLGNCFIFQKKYQKGLDQFYKAWALGDLDSLRQLGFVCVLTERWDELSRLVPDLLKNKDKNIEITNSLIASSLKNDPPNKTLFYKAVEGVPDTRLIEREDTRALVFKALEIFQDRDRLKRLKEQIKDTI